jgi:ribose transport system ATP-binding protein
MMVGRALTDEAVVVPDLAAAEVALEVKGISRGREVRDVSFAVKKGEILGFAGLMGAGRTEVARLIFGADPRDAGEILVHGVGRDIRAPKDAVRAGIGYLSEDRKHFGLALGMDVRANIAMASLERFSGPLGRLDETAMKEIADSYIDQLGIRTPSDRQELRLLSGGNQQKVVIAKWLLRNCDILIFDEPTRGIDVGAKAEIYALLHELAGLGLAILMASSELDEILGVSDRVLVMHEGRLAGELDHAAMTEAAVMALATGLGRESA